MGETRWRRDEGNNGARGGAEEFPELPWSNMQEAHVHTNTHSMLLYICMHMALDHIGCK